MSARQATAAVAIGILAACLVGTGCGSGSQGGGGKAAAEANAIVQRLGHLKHGEILIVGRKPVRYSGPDTFGPGGYVLRFRQRARADGSPAQLMVSLESHRGSSAKPYQRVIKTQQPKGKASVDVSGKLFIHVTTTSPAYVLRFTPRHQTGSRTGSS
jgi:hypothetical protein